MAGVADFTGTTHADWRPACSLERLRQRAALNQRIRRFFSERGVLEVETPLLGQRGVTDPALQPFTTLFRLPGQTTGQTLYLQTSPEFAMKRLLAAGSGSIYQIGKAFRNEECGRHHNPEFTLLEWYRVGYSMFDLIGEVEALIGVLANAETHWLPAERLSYREAFSRHTGLDPVTAPLGGLAHAAEALGLPEAAGLCGTDRIAWLDLLFSHCVQPKLGQQRLTSVYHYPAFMPSLAQACPGDSRYVERFEVFLSGLELGNGYHELADPVEQERRFASDNRQRQRQNLPVPVCDQRLLAALQAGLPDCSGIAMGLDRLLLALTGSEALEAVLAFPVDRA